MLIKRLLALRNLAEAVGLYLKEVDEPHEYMATSPLLTSLQVPGAS